MHSVEAFEIEEMEHHRGTGRNRCVGDEAGHSNAHGAQAVVSALRVLLRYESWHVYVGCRNRCRKLEGALDHIKGGFDARRVDFT
jgi:hypothetical protein